VVDWNKEISFGRKKDRAEEPEALDETQSLEPVELPDPEPELVVEPDPDPDSDPDPEPVAVDPEPLAEIAPEPELDPDPVAEDKPVKTSLLKKELSLSFRRKPKEAKLPKSELVETELEAPEAPARKERTNRKLRRQGGSQKRAKRVVGLKIGASQLAAARIVNNGSPELVQVAREDLEPGLVVGGELREPELLADALRAFFRKHKLPRQGVRLGIANNRIGVRIFEIAGIDDPKQLENAIRFRAQEALPIPIEEAVLDYHVLGERLDDEGHKVRRILLVVAYRELIDRYVAACKKAGIRLAGIDLEAFALLRALGDSPAADDDSPADAALVVVSIGHDRSTFAVSDGRVCEFTRVLDWGGQTLDVAIARELEIAPSEAAPLKVELSLATANVPEGLTQEQADNAREAVRRQLQTFARELVSSLQFYQNQPGSLGIGEILITGGTAHLAGLGEELQRLMGVRVAVGDPLMRVKLGRKVRETEQLGSLAVAIGLGIED
jgi:type IV pilus assembly protein PilM